MRGMARCLLDNDLAERLKKRENKPPDEGFFFGHFQGQIKLTQALC
jgi:hypothetical protein